jgi:hypothetical protein
MMVVVCHGGGLLGPWGGVTLRRCRRASFQCVPSAPAVVEGGPGRSHTMEEPVVVAWPWSYSRLQKALRPAMRRCCERMAAAMARIERESE